MLVLSRKSQEAVIIGGPDGVHRLLKVKVLEIRGANVKLGFEVDPEVPVHRAEVWERIRAAADEPARHPSGSCLSGNSCLDGRGNQS